MKISGGTISCDDSIGVKAEKSTVIITGGTVIGQYSGVNVDNCIVTVSGGTISGDTVKGGSAGVAAYDSAITICGGSISGGSNDLYNYRSTITLTLGKNGVGATFPGGIQVEDTTLNAILGEGAAYWQGDKQIIPADDATEITGGDVVIKACQHSWTDATCTTPKTCTVCSATEGEALDHGHTAGLSYEANANDLTHKVICVDCGISLEENEDCVFENSATCICGNVCPDGIFTDANGTKFYLIDGVKVAAGLVEIDGEFYYVRSNGALVIGQDYYVSKPNGLTHNGEAIKKGTYTFDNQGRIDWTLKNGIYAEDGGLYYYENGIRTYAGLIIVDGNYYYANSEGQIVRNGQYWITRTNGYMKAGSYIFDGDGVLIFD